MTPPADLVEWGRRNGIPEFAQAAWCAGFAQGWREAREACIQAVADTVKSYRGVLPAQDAVLDVIEQVIPPAIRERVEAQPLTGRLNSMLVE